MKQIENTGDLAEFCAAAAERPYVTVDTEFLRDRTYYAKLCLVQLAYRGDGDNDAALVDPLADDMDLEPLYDLFRDPSVVKVFHAARQDLEIFYIEGRVFPLPLFDTQVAAMVCGFGDQAGYETLVRHVAKRRLDKTSRFTDWSRRPLTKEQKSYALTDVTHLRDIYEHLAGEIDRTGRRAWVEEELASLVDPDTYVVAPEEAWKRVKVRSSAGKFLAAVKELARFREVHAQRKDVPRARVFKDDALLEIAALRPRAQEDLSRARLLAREARHGEIAKGILAAIRSADGMAPEDHPRLEEQPDARDADPAVADLLRVLLKAKSGESGVASKLIASASDLNLLAAGHRDLPCLRGWRAEVFGNQALKLSEGKMALGAKEGRVDIIDL